ncbi:ENV1 protein, partial [Crocuta crocuta]
MTYTYQVLNESRPNLTMSCWLCFNPKPPYYEGIAFLGNYSVTNRVQECCWQQTGQILLTLQSVTAQDLCPGHVPATHQHLCDRTDQISSPGYLIPPKQGWWACTTGLTPCVHGTILHNTKTFCVLAQLVPRILYHTDEELFQAIIDAKPSKWTKHEPFTTLTLSVLLGLGLAGAGTGISALAVQSSSYNRLRAAIDVDIQNLETSVSHLQKSLTSLAEVVLQNRTGLDLLFLQQGGLCAA